MPDVDPLTATHTEPPDPADRDDLTRLTERAGVITGIATGVLGVLLAVGFVFLPASTLLEKAYVLVACLALSVAAVAGIGAWRSARRFGVTATCACFAVVCLAALSMSAEREQPSPPTSPPGTSNTPSATPAVNSTPLPAGSVVFDDDFTTNRAWSTGSAGDGGGLETYKPGTLHLTAKAGAGAYFAGVPVRTTAGFTSLRIDATIARTAGNGDFGLQCQTSGQSTYDFWMASDGSANIEVFAATDNAESSGRQLASGIVSKWDPTQRHLLTAACVGVQGGTKLTFQIDGNVVATAFDTTHTESFEPFLIFQSTQQAALDLDILHVTVANLS